MAGPSLGLVGCISTNSFIAPATEMTENESWTEAAISRILLRYIINILSSWFSAGGNGPVGSRWKAGGCINIESNAISVTTKNLFQVWTLHSGTTARLAVFEPA